MGLAIDSAAHLYRVGEVALDRMAQIRMRKPGVLDALICVVFAAASLEAFINEFGDIARDKGSEPGLADKLEELEKSHRSTAEKYEAAGAFLGRPYNKGARPFQDFALLFDVRDAVVHVKPERYILSDQSAEIFRADILNGLRSKNILAQDDEGGDVEGFFANIETPALAKWALDAALAMIQELYAAVPESPFKQALQVRYPTFFGPAPVTNP